MNTAVDPVLELLEEQDIPMPPGLIHHVLDNEEESAPSYRSIMRALDPLEDHGLVKKVPDTSYYEITEEGRSYLSGDLDASDLDPDDE